MDVTDFRDRPITKARVDIAIDNNSTWEDAFLFGTVGDLSWNFNGQSFRADIKGNKDQTSVLLTVSSVAGTIVVDDPIQRILHFWVPEAAISAALQPGEYIYELMMFDGSVPSVRVPLMGGKLIVLQGVTGG